MAQKPMLVMAKAMSTARVTEVEPVMQGSRKDAVKQKRDFCRINPKQQPKTQNRARLEDKNVLSRTATTTISTNTRTPMGSWFFFFLRARPPAAEERRMDEVEPAAGAAVAPEVGFVSGIFCTSS